MKFKIGTAKLNAILSKVQKGVGGSNIVPITEYLHLELEDGTLKLTSTDLNNFMTYSVSDIEGEDGDVIVKAIDLIRLVSKTTKPEMSFKATDKAFEVKGNGNYKINILADHSFPIYEFDEDSKSYTVKTSDLKNVLRTNYSAIAKEMLVPCLTGYNLSSKSITTDGLKMCINDVKIGNEDLLIPQSLADLLAVIDSEEFTVQKDEDNLLFKTDAITIFGPELDGKEEYPDVTSILDLEHPASCVLSKAELLSVLDRLSIFVDEFDNHSIKMTFNKDSVEITDSNENSLETIEPKLASESNSGVTVTVNLVFLKELLGAISEEDVTVHYGEGIPIKLTAENLNLVLSIMDDEDTEEE